MAKKFSLDFKDLIRNEYQSGLQCREIIEKYQISEASVTRILRGLPDKRKRIDKIRIGTYELNINYFRSIDTPNKAYFLGLIVSDGCNTREGVRISLVEDDKHIIEDFKEDISYTGPLFYTDRSNYKWDKYPRKNQVGILINCTQISEDLSRLGIIPNKTLVLKYPQFPKEYNSHFIRGLSDGDGCVRVDKRSNNLSWGITGTVMILDKVTEILRKECNLRVVKYAKQKDRNPVIAAFEYAGNNSCKRIYDYLYKDAEVFLDRKRRKFESILNKEDDITTEL